MVDQPSNDTRELKELQKIWYQKLKESGFEDIEDTKSSREYLKTWHGSYFHLRYTPDTFAIKEEYYNRASRFLHVYRFKSKTEKFIWEKHSDGRSFRQIADLLKTKNIKANKDKINKIIQKLTDEMKEWFRLRWIQVSLPFEKKI